MKKKKKYYPLHIYLKEKAEELITNEEDAIVLELSFSEIEEIIDNTLPPSAQSIRAWWANTPTPQSESWLSTPWIVDYVNFPSKLVIFRPKYITHRVTPVRRRPGWAPEKVKELRKHADWSQQELADKMGVRQQTVSEWETGLHIPRYSTSKHLNLVAKEVEFPYQIRDLQDTSEDDE